MNVDRSILKALECPSLQSSNLRICTDAGEQRHYNLTRHLGTGKTGVAWHAADRFNREWAIKFVLRADYRTHSLEAEACRVSALTTQYIAKIDFYGKPLFDVPNLTTEPFYALVVQWVKGPSLEDYLENSETQITVPVLIRFTRALCEVVGEIHACRLCFDDLHSGNIIVSPYKDPLTNETSVNAIVIDTGTIKTEERRLDLLESWQSQLTHIQEAADEAKANLDDQLANLRSRIEWFNRTDQEWIVYHICALANNLIGRIAYHDVATKRFLNGLPALLQQMIDHDLTRRLRDPVRMYQTLERLWAESNQPDSARMTSPFDLMTAELVQNDRQLMDLFSDEFPGLAECRSNDPIYLYGPRGCGKSTILRSLSLRAFLSTSPEPEDLKKLPFAGIYLSCSSELRSRFWLMRPDDYDVLEGHVIRYFNLLLIEQLNPVSAESWSFISSVFVSI